MMVLLVIGDYFFPLARAFSGGSPANGSFTGRPDSADL
jgi:hypothetical protein